MGEKGSTEEEGEEGGRSLLLVAEEMVLGAGMEVEGASPLALLV